MSLQAVIEALLRLRQGPPASYTVGDGSLGCGKRVFRQRDDEATPGTAGGILVVVQMVPEMGEEGDIDRLVETDKSLLRIPSTRADQQEQRRTQHLGA